MALVVETGAGLANAESYASVAEADAYLAAVGNAVWGPLITADKETALRRATRYMQGEYGGRWLGLKATVTQALDHPRRDVPVADVYNEPGTVTYYESDELIVAVRNACIELAAKADETDLSPDIDRALIEDTIGPITQRWASGTSQVVRYRTVDAMLGALLKPKGFSVRTGRA